MPWQRLVADVGTEVVANADTGRPSWAYGVVIVHVQRQAGKSTLFGPVAHHRCATRPDAKVWLTAQTGYDARDLWLDMTKRLERSPFHPVVKIRRANGTESQTWPNGATFRPFPPVEEAQHGKANELVAVDEGWAFDDLTGSALEAAIVPTFTTTGGQLWILSAGGTSSSSWLLRHVLAGRAAVTSDLRSGIAYFEFGIDPDDAPAVAAGLGPEVAEAELHAALDVVLAAHPAAGHTLRRDALVTAARSMKPGEFLRAYGNHWTRSAERVIPETLWDAEGVRIPPEQWPPPSGGQVGTVALGFAASPDAVEGAVAAAWRDFPGGPMRVQILDARPGSAWLAEFVAAKAETWRPVAVGHDRAGPALDIADDLARGVARPGGGKPFPKVELTGTSTSQYASACSAFLRWVVTATLQHPGQDSLDDAVASAARRVIGDGLWAWSRKNSAASIAALEAATVAAYAYDNRGAAAEKPAVVVARPRVAVVARRRQG
jgi:hypothetical protein